MATISTNVYDNSKFELRITPTADNANLRYKLSWEIWLVISGGNWWEYNAIRINNAKINGTQVKGSETFSYYYGPGSWKLASGTTYVAYNSDGSDVKVSASISGWFYADGDVSGSGTVTCTGGGVKPTTNAMTAPSTAVISETSSTISVTWDKMSSYNNAGTYTLQVSQNGSAYADVTTISAIGTLSYSYSIPNKGQGTTYRFRIRANNNIGSGDWQYSGTVTINSLSPPTIGTLGTFNPYVNTTFNVPLSGGSQANGGGFKRCANIHVDGNYKYAGTAPSSNGNTSVNITVSAANILADLGANSYSSSTKFTIVAWIENANGTRSSYVSKSFTVNINSDGGATPSIGTISVSGGALSNPTTCFISGITTMGVSVSSVATRRGHANTTVSCKINYDSTNKNGTSASFASNTTGVRTITVTATDSRGLSSSKTYQVRVQSWAKPTIKITSVERLADPNTSATLNYSISYSPIYQYTDVNTAGNQLNGITSQQYNLNGGSWATASNGMTITGLSTELAYTVNVRCNDKVSTSSYGTNNGTVPSIQVELSIRKGRVGINGVPQSGYALDVYGKGRINGTLDVGNNAYISANLNVGSQLNYKNKYVYASSAGSSSNAYIKIATIVITTAYANRTIHFQISGRGNVRPTNVYIMFTNEQSLDPSLSSLLTDTSKIVYMAKVGTSTWDLYVASYSWEMILISEANYQSGYFNVTYHDQVTVASLPSGYTTSVADQNLQGYVMGETFEDSAWTTNVAGKKSLIGSFYQGNNWYNVISVRHRNGASDGNKYGLALYQLMTTEDSISFAQHINGSWTNWRTLVDSSNYKSYLLNVFPVGAVYITATNTNPSTFLGGTWVAFGQGQTLVGVNTSDSDFNTVLKTGGNKTVTLTTAQMPSHGDHLNTYYIASGTATGKHLATGSMSNYGSTGRGWNAFNDNEAYPDGHYEGGGGSHTNVQPYITVYFWRRTA